VSTAQLYKLIQLARTEIYRKGKTQTGVRRMSIKPKSIGSIANWIKKLLPPIKAKKALSIQTIQTTTECLS
jgi:hypothetical protein